jgi:hypothetical protein
MITKNSKYLAVLAAMLVFSILLASCQSMLATIEETDINRAEEAWGANFPAPGESYFKSYLEEMEQASVPWLDLSVPLIELRSDVPYELEEMKQASVPWIDLSVPLIELKSDVPFESEEMKQASAPLHGESHFESYLEEMEQASVPLQEANYFERYLEDLEQAGVPVYELRSEVLSEAEVVADTMTPGIQIRRTRLQARTFLTEYTVTSVGPGWVVFHADMDGEPGAMLKYVWVSDGISRINVVEVLEEMSSEPIHVMLHYDLGWIGYFEFPRTDPPVFVEDKMVNELCFCPN